MLSSTKIRNKGKVKRLKKYQKLKTTQYTCRSENVRAHKNCPIQSTHTLKNYFCAVQKRNI